MLTLSVLEQPPMEDHLDRMFTGSCGGGGGKRHDPLHWHAIAFHWQPQPDLQNSESKTLACGVCNTLQKL